MYSYHIKIKRIKWSYIICPVCLGIIYLLSACSNNPNRQQSSNVEITIKARQEALLDRVSSARLLVTTMEAGHLFDSSFVIEQASFDSSSIELELGPGDGRAFYASLKDLSNRTLFKSVAWGDIRNDRLLNIDLTLEQSGYGSGTVMKIIRDEPPWGSYGLDTSLMEIGLTVGTSSNQFYIYTSEDISGIGLMPGVDALIISNDQPQQFYDNLATNLHIITGFAQKGGTVLWGACDLAWNYGSYASAGLDSFPGGVRHVTSYDEMNFIQDGELSLTSGLSNTLAGIYASNKHFIDVPDSAIIYLRDSSNEPTLIGYPFGLGWIILSGQPLEYNYDRRENYNMGFLLPRIASFILGITWDGIPVSYNGGDDFRAAGNSAGRTTSATDKKGI